MQVIEVHEFGGPEVLQVGEANLPQVRLTLNALCRRPHLLHGRQEEAATMCEPLAEPIDVELKPRSAISA